RSSISIAAGSWLTRRRHTRVLKKESVRRDVEDARRQQSLQCFLGGLRAAQNLRFRKQRLNRSRFLRCSLERSEVHTGKIFSRSDIPLLDLARNRLHAGRAPARNRYCPWLAEERVCDHYRPALALSRHLHSKQIAPRSQITYRIAFNQVPMLLIDQRLKRDQVKLPVRRDEQMRGIAGQGADWSHDVGVHSARKLLHIVA